MGDLRCNCSGPRVAMVRTARDACAGDGAGARLSRVRAARCEATLAGVRWRRGDVVWRIERDTKRSRKSVRARDSRNRARGHDSGYGVLLMYGVVARIRTTRANAVRSPTQASSPGRTSRRARCVRARRPRASIDARSADACARARDAAHRAARACDRPRRR